MLLSKPTLKNMVSKFGMVLLFLLISNLSMALIWESDNAKGYSITSAIRISVLSRIQAKTTRVRRNAKPLKKRDEIEEDDSLILVYQDEVHFQIQTTITSGWFKKGSAPKVKSFPGRFKTSYSGFVIPESGQLFTVKPETFNYETTIDSIRSFLSAHPAPEGKRYALVMDNAPWHKKTMRLVETEMLPEHSDIRESVTFIKLPPYSPDLNPIEQVWRIMRKENTHNVFFASLSLLETTLDSAFDAWALPNVQLRSLCSFK